MSHSQGISGDDFYNPCPEPPIPPSPKIIFVPEINFWGLQIISKSCVYQDFKRYPVPVKESEWRRTGSILDLLFNYTFDYSTYSIYYTKVRSCDIDDININQRSTVRAGQLSTYVCDTSAALEVFNISDVDFGLPFVPPEIFSFFRWCINPMSSANLNLSEWIFKSYDILGV